MRQLAEWEENKAELEKLDCTIYAISIDTLEQAQEVVAKGLTFPVAYGATKEDGELLDVWWGTRQPDGEYIQPAEFLLGRGGVVLGAMYPSGPVGRMGADEAIRQITGRAPAPSPPEDGAGAGAGTDPGRDLVQTLPCRTNRGLMELSVSPIAASHHAAPHHTP